ncbi:MAG: cation diffusion facilitator family transporter [Clostridia bacterium]
MGHNHSHNHSKSSNIAVAFFLNFGFAILEIFGGIITRSVAIMSDAVHDFGDSLTLGLSWIFEKKAKKKPDEKYTYGYKRLPVVGALINILVLSLGTAFVIYKAINAIITPNEVMSKGMFILSIFGILTNGLAVFRMKGSKKLLDKTVMLHLLEDLLGWIAVFIVSIIIYFTNFYLLDPILSLCISVFLIINIYNNVKESIVIIMQASPNKGLTKEIENELLGIEGVKEIQQLHIWSFDGEENVLTVKIVIDDNTNRENLLNDAKQLLKEKNINQTTIEIG